MGWKGRVSQWKVQVGMEKGGLHFSPWDLRESGPQAPGTDYGGSERLGEGWCGRGQGRGLVAGDKAREGASIESQETCECVKATGYILKAVLRCFKQENGQIR